MRHALASLALLLPLAGASAEVESDFMPVARAVDHVVTMADTSAGGGRSSSVRRITHHAGWSRVELVANGRSDVRSYIGHAAHTTIQMPRWPLSADEWRQLVVFHWPPEQAKAHFKRNARTTGERRIVLGETCEVWEVVPLTRGPSRAGTSCAETLRAPAEAAPASKVAARRLARISIRVDPDLLAPAAERLRLDKKGVSRVVNAALALATTADPFKVWLVTTQDALSNDFELAI